MWSVENLNAELLDLKLWGEGCTLYQIRQLGDDEYCLIQDGECWQVVYAERGAIQEVLFESTDEAAACALMYRMVKSVSHPHIVGLFQTDTEADQCCQVLTQLQIQYSRDVIPSEGGQVRVRVYDQDLFKVERHFGSLLPLQRWLTVPERIHITLGRLRQFDPHNRYAEITTNPPIGSEAKVNALEAQYGIQLPEVYRTFLRDVCNGGNWERLGQYWSIEEVMTNNSAELWNQSLPDFLAQLKLKKSQDTINNPGDQQYSGLLQIVDWNNPVRDLFLTQEGYEVEIQGDVIRFSNYSPEQWLNGFLDDIQYALSNIEDWLAWLRSGKAIQTYLLDGIRFAEMLGHKIHPQRITDQQLMAVRDEVNHQVDQWRIENMGKMQYNFGFNAEQAEARSQRLLEKFWVMNHLPIDNREQNYIFNQFSEMSWNQEAAAIVRYQLLHEPDALHCQWYAEILRDWNDRSPETRNTFLQYIQRFYDYRVLNDVLDAIAGLGFNDDEMVNAIATHIGSTQYCVPLHVIDALAILDNPTPQVLAALEWATTISDRYYADDMIRRCACETLTKFKQ